MAENRENIFIGVLDALRRNKSGQSDPITTQTQRTQMLDARSTGSSREQAQQQFLDMQVQKIASDIYSRTIYFDTDRVSAYQDYEAMDHSPEVRQALNIMRDECLTPNEYGEILQIYSDQDRVKSALKDLFVNRLNANFMLKLWIRETLKYGDHFVYLNVHKDQGIMGIRDLPVAEVFREEGYDDDVNSVRFRWETGGEYFEEFQVAHFRMLEDTKRIPYGRSILDAARKTWKQLQLAEDALLVYRITRAPDRRVFYIEVGNLDMADVGLYIQAMQRSVKKAAIVDQRTGNKDFKYNPQNVTEDFWMPVRGDHHSKIDTLPGACLALDTKIRLLDGRSLMLSEIIKEHESGKELWAYSINPKTGEVVPGPITWAGVTRKDAQVVKLTLDNGETMVVTPDHKFPTKFNGKKEAKDLLGESLWSFNTKREPYYKSSKKTVDYEHVYDHSINKFVPTHRMVGDFMKKHPDLYTSNVFDKKYKNSGKNTIHHINFDRFNNAISNLTFMNYYDHRSMHGHMVAQYKKEREAGIDQYWADISENELEKKREVARKNFYKGTLAVQELLKDEEYKKEFYEKASKALRVTQNRPEFKKRQSKNAKEQWKSGSIREAVAAKQKLKYSEAMLQFVVAMTKDGADSAAIIEAINTRGSKFMSEFMSLNAGNKQLAKMKNGFTHNNLCKMLSEFGYKNWKEFKKNAVYFNHKVVSVEWLDEHQDTGTLTIDGGEAYHDYHTFALDCEVFTYNSNLGDIQDIEYLENKLFCSLVVPKAYLNFAEGLQGGTTLSQSDIRFARTIIGFQESMLMELTRVAKIHLLFLGYKDDYENFELRLNNPSTQLELMKLEIMKARLEVAKEWHSMDANSFASWTWVMENILGFSKNDIKKMLKQKKVEKKLFAEIDAGAETYRKTGIFADIDSKYEIAGADPNGGTETEEGGGGEGGFNAGSALGDDGSGAGMGGEMPDLGGGEGPELGGSSPSPAPSPTGGSAPESAPEMALGESRRPRQASFEGMVNELFEEEESKEKIIALARDEKNSLIEKSNQVMKGADSLFAAIQKRFGNIPHNQGRQMIKEAPLVHDSNNPLLQDYNEHTSRLAEIIEKMEQQGIEDAEEVILPDNTVIEEQSDDEIEE